MGMSVLETKPGLEVLISQEQVRARVRELGAEISRDYEGKELLLLAVLKGAAVFLADLLREISGSVTYDFMATSSYGTDTKSSGVVRLLKDVDKGLAGRHVLIVEDIVDTGLTLSYLLEVLSQREPASLRVCTLLDKPTRRVQPVQIDYCGFTIPDRFVVGYGLDHDEQYRNLPFVGALSE
jgi:hypoxanthine phosphoribosyltransferase